MWHSQKVIWNVAYERHPGGAGHKYGIWKIPWGSLCGPEGSSISNVIATSMLCSSWWSIWFLWAMWDDLLYSTDNFLGDRTSEEGLWPAFHSELISAFQFPVSKWGSRTVSVLGGMSQMSVFHFSKSVVSRFKLHIFWQLCHQWCGLSIRFPRVGQSICSSEDGQS